MSSVDAIVQLASDLQDLIVEESHGAAVPPCPGHPHPLSSRAVDGTAVWVCPRDPDHFREPIL